jgi:hypothetical protein
MKYELYSSIDEMLMPNVLSQLEGRPIDYARCLPFNSEASKSGSHFLVVETNGDPGSRYLLKRVALAWDWLMRNTDDHRCRSVRLWQYGLLDRLPPEIEHGIVACAHDGEGWAVLMRDVSAGLVPYACFSQEENELFLAGLATIHATFWQMPKLDDPALGLCTLRQIYTVLSPQTGHREAGGPDGHPKLILEGWDLLKTLVAEDVAGIIESLLEDPQPLCAALARYPHTLLHGDYRQANLGRLRGDRDQAAVLDWQLAAMAPPAVDLARYLATNSALLPISKEATIDAYRQQLAQGLGDHFDENWWQPQLELGLLGAFVQDGWAIALKATHWSAAWTQETGGPNHWRADLAWWSEQVRTALKWL